MTAEFLRELEGKLLPKTEWETAPKLAREIAEAETALGVSTGIAYDPRVGWVVLQSSGQGPYVIWESKS